MVTKAEPRPAAGVVEPVARRLPRWIGSPPAIVALLVYLIAALLMFGSPLIHPASHSCICLGTDEGIFVWAMAWWPHAIAHGLNPFYSHMIYAPQGFDIALGALVPGVSLLLAPVTAVAGPLFSYNLAMLLSPVLAAFFAFLLCRRLTRAFWPALVGGWLFGFSTYMLGQLMGHLHLTVVFLIPAMVHLALRALAGELSRRVFVALMALALIFQFLFSAEVFVTFTLFGAVALASAFAFADAELRARLRHLLWPLAAAYLVTAAVVSPYLYYAFQPGGLPVLLWRTDHFSSDLLAFVVPTPVTKLGGLHFLSTSNRFTGGIVEGGAYFGLPLILILVLAVRRWWRRAEVRVMVVTLIVVLVCSLGGTLQVRGKYTIPLPWAVMHRLPVLGLALPSRFVVYGFLIAALLAAMWLARARLRIVAWGLAALSVASLWPALGQHYWHGFPPQPALFTSSGYRKVIRPSDTALVVPVGGNGYSMLWQGEAHVGFTMASGYVVPPEAPDPYKRDPIYPTLTLGAPVAHERAVAQSFLRSHHITVAVVDPTEPVASPWLPLLKGLGWRARLAGGVVLLRPPAGSA